MSIVVLDRDGVINHDSKDYIKRVEDWRPISGSIRAIKTISHKGYSVYIATNQAGLGRKLFRVTELQKIHQRLFDLVKEAGGVLNGIVYCPHHPDEGCACRKPGTAMLGMIQHRSNRLLKDCYFVGDSTKDIEAALAFGCKPALVMTGNGQITLAKLTVPQRKVTDVFNNLEAFSIRLVSLV